VVFFLFSKQLIAESSATDLLTNHLRFKTMDIHGQKKQKRVWFMNGRLGFSPGRPITTDQPSGRQTSPFQATLIAWEDVGKPSEPELPGRSPIEYGNKSQIISAQLASGK
jgi:hypothetical protein